MRLQLIIAALALSAGAAQAQIADEEPGKGDVKGSFAVYADDDETSVVTSVVDGSVRMPIPVTINAHALVDVVSSASVDVVSAATKRFEENRFEEGVSARIGVSRTTKGSIGYTHSAENDWQSHAMELGLSRDFANNNAKVSIGYGFTRNHVGRAKDPNFERMLDIHGAQVGLAQVLDRRSLLTVAYTLSFASGYQGSPYRFITTMGGFSAPESPPAERLRHAVTARVMRMLDRSNTLDASYRFYLDDWAVSSHTVELAFTRSLTDCLFLRLRTRGYRQGRAAFYRESYDMPMRYMTVDRELSTFWDALGGIKVGYTSDGLDVDLKVDGIYYKFADYARLAGRVALVTNLGVTWRW